MKTILFNPYTGRPRHPSDIASDPEGLLIAEPEAPLIAAPRGTPTTNAANLPDLPVSEWHPWGAPVYTADQMRAYALVASTSAKRGTEA